MGRRCFVCLKHLHFGSSSAVSSSVSLENDNLSSDRKSSILYSRFTSFLQQYLQISTDEFEGDVDEEEKSETGGFCDPCSTNISVICNLYKELAAVELDLSTKLKELGLLINKSQLSSDKLLPSQAATKSSTIQLGNHEQLRNKILDKCFQKFGQAIGGLLHNEENQESANSATNEYDEDIKPDLEELLNKEEKTNENPNLRSATIPEYQENEEFDEYQDGQSSDSFIVPHISNDDDEDVSSNEGKQEVFYDEAEMEEDENSDVSFQPSDDDNSDEDDDNAYSEAESENFDEMETEEEQRKQPRAKGIQSKRPKMSSSSNSKKKKNTSILSSIATYFCDDIDDSGCAATFETQEELNSHLETHSKPIHFCSECPASFLNPEYLKVHEIIHAKWVPGFSSRRGEKIIRCPVPSCTSYKSCQKDMQTHYNNKHGQKLNFLQCSKCNQRFKSDFCLNNHYKKAHDPSKVVVKPKPFKCPLCERRFPYPAQVATHLPKCVNNPERVRSGKKLGRPFLPGSKPKKQLKKFGPRLPPRPVVSPDKIAEQVKTFVSNKLNGLEIPILSFGTTPKRIKKKKSKSSDHPEGPFVCEVCGETFPLLKSLKPHIYQSHGAGKNIDKKRKNPLDFVCATCGKAYTNLKSLRKHEADEAVHITGEMEKKFECHLCSKKYSHKLALKAHLRKAHRKEKGQEFTPGEGAPRKDQKCLYPSCPQAFFEEDELKAHVEGEHHQSQHPFMCLMCGRTFENSQRLTRHNLIHLKEKQFKCHLCKGEFTLRQSLKEHLTAVHGQGNTRDEWPCTQPGCHGRFKCEQYLKTHLRQIHGITVNAKKEARSEWPCTQPDCESKFKTRAYLQRHLNYFHGLTPGKATNVKEEQC